MNEWMAFSAALVVRDWSKVAQAGQRVRSWSEHLNTPRAAEFYCGFALAILRTDGDDEAAGTAAWVGLGMIERLPQEVLRTRKFQDWSYFYFMAIHVLMSLSGRMSRGEYYRVTRRLYDALTFAQRMWPGTSGHDIAFEDNLELVRGEAERLGLI